MQDAPLHRKDCGNTHILSARPPVPARAPSGLGTGSRPARVQPLVAALVLAGALCAAPVHAGSVRLWPSAVVVQDSVRVADVCELRGFDYDTERRLADVVVTEAPPPGGSLILHMDRFRTALAAGGANMALVTLHGATRCTIRRPSAPVERTLAKPQSPGNAVEPGRAATSGGSDEGAAGALTLRQAIIDHFNAELARYGGKADIVFDTASAQALELTGPAYEFRVRRREGSLLGLLQLAVEVISDGRLIQTVPMVVQVSMVRHAVVARRAINQGATIQSEDVERVAFTFTRLDKLGIAETARAVGQRARRFIAAGSLLEPGMLESVPLVTRGQLVSVHSVAGSVQVVTTAKVLQDGLLGEVVTIQAPDHKRLELEATVIGPGTVQLGGPAQVKGRGRQFAANVAERG